MSEKTIVKKYDVKTILKEYGIYLALIILVIFFSSVTGGKFQRPQNILNVMRQISMLGIASVGMAFVLLLGGIDLSIGSNITLVNIVASWLMVNAGFNPVIACFVALVMSIAVGFGNGWIIANIKMPPLIVTLASMTILEGIAYMICNGVPIFGFPKWFEVIGQGYAGPIPIPVIIMIVILAIGAFILNETYFGRYFYAVGGNEEASALSGINVKRVKYLAYTLSGFFAGIAGIVMLSRTMSGQALAGKGFEFDVLTAVVLGGVSINGGSGRISNVVAGILILGVLSNGMVLMDLSQYTQMVLKGAVLMAAVGFDCLQKAKKSKHS
ncbi:MAG: ABC transporter permease [Spirochaetaceae bacterium]|jgi:ribose transport system permease protein|nr:ABC transporter permease [Spirochaetaceae bacterium]